jgi:adenylate cyclase
MNMNNSYLPTYIDLISAYGTTGQIEEASQTLAELHKRDRNLTIQKYRQLAYAFSGNPQYRREIDDIVDGLRKGGVREQ